MTSLSIPHMNRVHFWPDSNSPTLYFDEVIRFQVLSSTPADCYPAVGSSEKYREYEFFSYYFIKFSFREVVKKTNKQICEIYPS